MRILKYQILLVVALTALRVAAGDFESNGIVYSFSDRHGEVVVDENIVDGLNVYTGVCIIPSMVNCDGYNYRVTGIADGAFYNSKVAEVVMPNSVTKIGEEAFLVLVVVMGFVAKQFYGLHGVGNNHIAASVAIFAPSVVK